MTKHSKERMYEWLFYALELTYRLLMVLAVAGMALMIYVKFAYAHEAPAGWEYDQGCCSDRDCGVMAFNTVVPTQEGWHVRLEAGDHHYFEGAVDMVIPFDDSRLRKSQDTEFHICLSKSGILFCLYVPPMGG